MGSCSSNDSTQMPLKIAKYFQYISDLNCEYNVNKAYSHIIKIDKTATVGTGIKKVTYFLTRLKHTFFQVHGNNYQKTESNFGKQGQWENNNAGKLQNIHFTPKTALLILKQKKVFLYKENIQVCYDIAYNRYQIPIFCINQPSKFINNQQLQISQKKKYQTSDLEIRIRCAKFPTQDYSMSCNLNSTVQFVKSCFKQNKRISQKQNVRIFFNGKEMMDGRSLGDYECFYNCVLQGMIIQ